MHFKPLIPMLNVSDIERSVEFYRDMAGFQVLSDEEALKQWRWAHIETGECALMLSESGGPSAALRDPDPDSEHDGWPVIFYFYPEDVVAHHSTLKSKGFGVSDLRVTFYQMKEFTLRDPDGHLLWFGQDTDEPPTPCA